jgi:hypothetical protein
MIQAILSFLILCVLFFVGIKFFQKMNGSQVLALTKIAGYSILCSLLAIAVLISIVVVF